MMVHQIQQFKLYSFDTNCVSTLAGDYIITKYRRSMLATSQVKSLTSVAISYPCILIGQGVLYIYEKDKTFVFIQWDLLTI